MLNFESKIIKFNMAPYILYMFYNISWNFSEFLGGLQCNDICLWADGVRQIVHDARGPWSYRWDICLIWYRQNTEIWLYGLINGLKLLLQYLVFPVAILVFCAVQCPLGIPLTSLLAAAISIYKLFNLWHFYFYTWQPTLCYVRRRKIDFPHFIFSSRESYPGQLSERPLTLLSILDIWQPMLSDQTNSFSQESYPDQLGTSLSERPLTLLFILDNTCWVTRIFFCLIDVDWFSQESYPGQLCTSLSIVKTFKGKTFDIVIYPWHPMLSDQKDSFVSF